MDGDHLPLFCDLALAERIERVEAQLIAAASDAARARRADTVGFAIPLEGGVASYAEPDSPFNKVAGLGFGGVPAESALDEIERAYGERGCPVRVELPHLADPAIGALLTGRGYQLDSFENVLGRALTGGMEHVAPAGVELRASGDDELEQWLDVVVDGFAHPDDQGVPSNEEFPRQILLNAVRDVAAAGVTRYAALHRGVLAGGGSFRVSEGVAQLAGAATAPAHRRRGIQTALLSARLARATEAGCDVAVITTQPASKSQQNAQRAGFSLLYTRAVLVRHP